MKLSTATKIFSIASQTPHFQEMSQQHGIPRKHRVACKSAGCLEIRAKTRRAMRLHNHRGLSDGGETSNVESGFPDNSLFVVVWSVSELKVRFVRVGGSVPRQAVLVGTAEQKHASLETFNLPLSLVREKPWNDSPLPLSLVISSRTLRNTDRVIAHHHNPTP